jgi:hypothetical protein
MCVRRSGDARGSAHCTAKLGALQGLGPMAPSSHRAVTHGGWPKT